MTDTDETPRPELDDIVDQYDDFEPIDGNEAADQLDMSLTEFGAVVEDDPRFEFGASPRFPWINMETYRNWSHQQNDRPEEATDD